MRKIAILAMIPFMALTACEEVQPPRTAAKDIVDGYRIGEVKKFAQAPDGTILWIVRGFDGPVYFSSKGTQSSHYDSNQEQTVIDRVPNAQ